MKNNSQIFSFAFFLLILYLSFLLFKPFLGTLIMALIASYILYPLYKKMNQKIKNDTLTVLAIFFIISLIIFGPLVLILYNLLDNLIDFVGFVRSFDPSTIHFISPEMLPIVKNYLMKFTENAGSEILSLLTRIIPDITEKIFNMVVFLFAVYLFLKNGPELIKKFRISLPIEKEQKDTLFNEFEVVTKSMIYSIFFSSIMSAIIAGVVFYTFGIPNSFLLGFLVLIMSFIPIIGGFPVWLGAFIYLLLAGNYLLAGILMIIYFLSNQLENILIMKIIGKKAQINFFLIFIGIVSGVKVFGPLGLILGPLILSLLVALIRFYTKDYKQGINL